MSRSCDADFGLVVNDEGRLALYNTTGSGCTALKPRQQAGAASGAGTSVRAIPSTRSKLARVEGEEGEGGASDSQGDEDEGDRTENEKDCLRLAEWMQLSLVLSYETNVLTLHCDGEAVATATANNIQVRCVLQVRVVLFRRRALSIRSYLSTRDACI